MGKTVLEGRGHVRSGYVTAYHAVLMHWSCSNLPVPKEVQPSHRITTFGFHRLRMNVIRFHSSLYLQQRSKRSQELHMEKQQQTIKSFLLSALIFFFFSLTGSRMLEYDGSTWHEDCFACHGCEKPIGTEAFIPDKNNYYCVPCYEGRFAPQCSHCKKVQK